MGLMCVMGQIGDVKVEWDATNEDEVDSVRKQFDDLKAKGYLFFAVHDDGKQGALYDAFSPMLGKAIFSKERDMAEEAAVAVLDKPEEKKPEGQIKEFDPKAEKIVATPPIRGG